MSELFLMMLEFFKTGLFAVGGGLAGLAARPRRKKKRR